MTDTDDWRKDQRDYDRLMADDGPDSIDPEICLSCNGSGEGRYEGYTCLMCKGTGEVCSSQL